MQELQYRFFEVDSIIRFTTEFLTSSDFTAGPAFMERLARHFDADFAGTLFLGQDRSPEFALGLMNRPANLSAVPGLGLALSSIADGSRRAPHVQSVAPSTLLVSGDSQAADGSCALVLYRIGETFSRKEDETLRMIQSVVRPKLMRYRQEAGSEQTEALPRRLQQVQEGLLDGLSDKQIATRLQISHHTIHVYVKSLFKRSGVCSRGEFMSRFVKQPQVQLTRMLESRDATTRSHAASSS